MRYKVIIYQIEITKIPFMEQSIVLAEDIDQPMLLGIYFTYQYALETI